MNVDVSGVPRQIGARTARVICDHQGMVHGAMLKHYSRSVSIETVELLALRDGFRFSLANFFSSLIIESDDTNAVNSIKNKSILSSDGSIMVEILDLLSRWWYMSVYSSLEE